LFVILVAAKLLSERVPRIHLAEQQFYDWLQSHILPLDDATGKIAIVDISGLDLVKDPRHPERESHTSRDALQDLINELDALGPAGIAVDVDFSATPDGRFYVEKEDEKFLEFCLNIRKTKTKGDQYIFVGVYDGAALGPLALGDPNYVSLAAFIRRPKAEEFPVAAEMDEWIDVPYAWFDGSTRLQRFPALGAAFPHESNRDPRWLDWAVLRERQDPIVTGKVQGKGMKLLVDFSPIERFETEAVTPAGKSDLAGSRAKLQQKFVFVGRVARPMVPDVFTVPGHRDHSYGGVLLEACTLYTLLSGPMRHLTPYGQVAADFVLWFFISLLMVLVQLYFLSSPRFDEMKFHRLNKLLICAAVVVVFVLGEFFVNTTRLIWDDYFLVIAVLVLHFFIESRKHTRDSLVFPAKPYEKGESS
jgi:CHASE2 domain-containing sensor protein